MYITYVHFTYFHSSARALLDDGKNQLERAKFATPTLPRTSKLIIGKISTSDYVQDTRKILSRSNKVSFHACMTSTSICLHANFSFLPGSSNHTLAWQCESVVRTMIKVNGKSQNLTTRHPKTSYLIITKIYLRDYVVDTYHPAKFHPDQIRGFVSAHARFREF